MKRYYFDHAAATPLDPRVEKAMKPYWSQVYGNPGALHRFGQEASAAVFAARQTMARLLNCSYEEIVFTGSATEANNLALRGVVKSVLGDGNVLGVVTDNNKRANASDRTTGTSRTSAAKPKIVVSAIEHDSVLDTAKDLAREGIEVVYLPVTRKGIVDLAALEKALDDRTVLVSVMYANNEIGAIQPIAEISKIIADFRNRSSVRNVQNVLTDKNKRVDASDRSSVTMRTSRTIYPLLHTDAAQAFNYLSCDTQELGVDLMTLSSQKIYGPKGVGMLYVRNVQNVLTDKNKRANVSDRTARSLEPIITGGHQEFGLRAGTENVPAIVGFATAAEIADKMREKESRRLTALRDYLVKKVRAAVPGAELNGNPVKRLPNNINLYFPPRKNGKGTAQDMVVALDLAGFAVSPGAACTARTCMPSHVLLAIGQDPIRAMSGVRITLGRQSDKNSIDRLIGKIYTISSTRSRLA
ncbi:MAG: cysteine desulfurase [Patescibacteria group bacterium]|nr:cysteine desulfurase [Patescibacteria group bacterium]